MSAEGFPPPNKPPRRIWPWWLGGVAVVAVAVLVIVLMLRQPDAGDPTATTPTPTSEPTASTTPEPSASGDLVNNDPSPTGCLAGPGLDAATLLAAQDAAPHSANGAVEFTTQMLRFTYHYPYPSEPDQAQVQQEVIATGSAIDVAAVYAAQPEIGGDVAPPGTPVQLSMTNGAWFLDSYTEDRAIVTVAYNYVADGALISSVGGVATYVLVWDEGWRVLEAQDPSRGANEVLAEGTPFSGGC